MIKQIIKIMPDYECFPLWEIHVDGIRNLDPEELPISRSLKKLLFDWQEKYDATLNMTDPRESGFKNSQEEMEFEREGELIYKLMVSEIGKDYDMTYFNWINGILYHSPDELDKAKI